MKNKNEACGRFLCFVLGKFLSNMLTSFVDFLEMRFKPGFLYTTTTQKQSDYEVEQSSFTLIALFCLKIGRCRGRNWLNGDQVLLI